MPTPLIENDATILGIFLIILCVVFLTVESEHKFWKKFYDYVPALLFCYVFPSLLNTTEIISGEQSKLYHFSSQYLIPASLVLLVATVDLKAILSLGKPALLTFLSGSVGIIIGAPLALMIVCFFSPEFKQEAINQEYWKGLIAMSGSWIGGSSSQLTLKEIYGCKEELFLIILVVDAVVANTWTALLIYGVKYQSRFNKWLRASNDNLESLKNNKTIHSFNTDHLTSNVGNNKNNNKNIIKTGFLMQEPKQELKFLLLFAVAFGGSGLAHLFSNIMMLLIKPHESMLLEYGLKPFTSSFLWLIIFASVLGLIASFTPIKRIQSIGATPLAGVFTYFSMMTIGMKLNLYHLNANSGLLMVCIVWLIIHGIVMFITARWLKAPYFFVAVGSQANIGGISTSPAVAAVFHPALAPVGVLLAVLSMLIGTYGGMITAWLLQFVN